MGGLAGCVWVGRVGVGMEAVLNSKTWVPPTCGAPILRLSVKLTQTHIHIHNIVCIYRIAPLRHLGDAPISLRTPHLRPSTSTGARAAPIPYISMAPGNRSPTGRHQDSDSASESDSGSIVPHERRHAAPRRDDRTMSGRTPSARFGAKARCLGASMGSQPHSCLDIDAGRASPCRHMHGAGLTRC